MWAHSPVRGPNATHGRACSTKANGAGRRIAGHPAGFSNRFVPRCRARRLAPLEGERLALARARPNLREARDDRPQAELPAPPTTTVPNDAHGLPPRQIPPARPSQQAAPTTDRRPRYPPLTLGRAHAPPPSAFATRLAGSRPSSPAIHQAVSISDRSPSRRRGRRACRGDPRSRGCRWHRSRTGILRAPPPTRRRPAHRPTTPQARWQAPGRRCPGVDRDRPDRHPTCDLAHDPLHRERGADADRVAHGHLVGTHPGQSRGDASHPLGWDLALPRVAERHGHVRADGDPGVRGTGDDPLKRVERLVDRRGTEVATSETLGGRREDRYFAGAGVDRPFEAAVVRHEHREAGVPGYQRVHHLRCVSELRNAFGMHEARRLDDRETAAEKPLDQLDLHGGGNERGLVLQTVARSHLVHSDARGQRCLQ